MVCKGILLYTTIIASAVLLVGADSLFENNLLFPIILLTLLLIYLCYRYINKKDADILLFVKCNDDKEDYYDTDN